MVSPNGFPRPRPEVTRMSVRQLKAELSARDVEISHCRDLGCRKRREGFLPFMGNLRGPPHPPPNANPPQEMRPYGQSFLISLVSLSTLGVG